MAVHFVMMRIWRELTNITNLITYCVTFSTINEAQWHIPGKNIHCNGRWMIRKHIITANYWPKYWCNRIILWCCQLIYTKKRTFNKKKKRKKSVWRPATPSFCWSWSQQRLAFILGRNRWLNMTGRKWESEAADASRYCQITRRMRQISPFLHLVLVISLATFSSLIPLVWRYVVGGLIYSQWGGTISNSNVIRKLSLPGYQWSKKEICSAFWQNITYFCLIEKPFHAPYFAMLKYQQLEYLLYAFIKLTPWGQMDIF